MWRGILGFHLRLVALKFFCYNQRQCSEAALAHFSSGETDHHGVVWLDDDPSIDFLCASYVVTAPRRGQNRGRISASRIEEAQGQAARSRQCCGNETTACHIARRVAHDATPSARNAICGAMNRASDAGVGSAPANVRHLLVDLAIGRSWKSRQQSDSS